jgi:uncharacterized protein YndB with AHSA1/START domain
MTHPGNIRKTIHIKAPALKVWATLTEPALMKQWVIDSDVDIISEWKTGSPLIIRGNLHGLPFDTRGTILQFEPGQLLQYTQWSTLSEIEDVPENYSMITFSLSPEGGGTTLAFTQNGFATEVIYQHLNFYWNTALDLIRRLNEN